MTKSVVVLAAIGLSTLTPGAMAYWFSPFGDGGTVGEVLACDLQDIRSEISAQQVKYTARGFCKRLRQNQPASSRGSSTFDNFDKNSTELYRFSWTSVGIFNPTTRSTFEEMAAPPPRIDEVAPAGRPYGQYQREMVCDKDPWLEETSRCTAPRVTATGVLTEQDKKVLGFSNRPFTALLKPEQRQALRNAQRVFDERQAALARIGNQQLSSATSTTRAGATTAPTAGALGSVGSSSTTVQGATAAPAAVTPPAGTSGTNTGTVSAALRLQAALDAQRRAQAGQAAPAPGAAMPASPAAPTPAPSNAAPAPTPGPAATPTPAPTAPPAASVASQATATAAPRVTLPSPNSQVRQGQLRVQAALPGAGASRAADVEFTRVATAPGATTDSSTAQLRWTVPIDQLAAGVPVPAASGPRSSGRWQMRVRLAGGASAWSEPVVFDYVATAGNEWKGKAWGHSNQLERQGLNPQPLPPKEAAAASQLEQQGLNPQPLPPKEAARATTQVDQRALNPQPLPPKEAKKANPFERPVTTPQQMPPAATQLDRQGLNPQPLPPKDAAPSSTFQR